MSEKNNSVDQIRDILFGEQVKIFEQKFTRLEADINAKVNSINKQLEALGKQLTKNMQSLKTSQSQGNSEIMEEHSKVINNLEASLSNKIVDTEAGILNELQQKIDDLDHKASHRKDLAVLLKDLSEKLQG